MMMVPALQMMGPTRRSSGVEGETEVNEKAE